MFVIDSPYHIEEVLYFSLFVKCFYHEQVLHFAKYFFPTYLHIICFILLYSDNMVRIMFIFLTLNQTCISEINLVFVICTALLCIDGLAISVTLLRILFILILVLLSYTCLFKHNFPSGSEIGLF